MFHFTLIFPATWVWSLFSTRQHESRKSARETFPSTEGGYNRRYGFPLLDWISSCHDQRSIFSRRMMRALAWPVGKSSINRRNSATRGERERETRHCHLQSRPRASLPTKTHRHDIERLSHMRICPHLECSFKNVARLLVQPNAREFFS